MQVVWEGPAIEQFEIVAAQASTAEIGAFPWLLISTIGVKPLIQLNQGFKFPLIFAGM